jgi:hypothetical protein
VKKKSVKIAGLVVVGVLLLLTLGLTYYFVRFPDVDPPSVLTVEQTPERIARGSYLANHVCGCIDCHSERDWRYFGGPLVPGTEGKGGLVFDEGFGLPGTLYSKNITPAGLGSFSDGELYRVLTTGVTKDGHALFPLMPYPHFSKLTEDDIYSIIAYIRTLAPIDSKIPERHLNFPVNLIVRMIPQRHVPAAEPNHDDPYDYGRYLVNAAGCADCHTPVENGDPIKGMDFAGGMKFRLPFGVVRAANLTPDEETGIGQWTKEMFISRFKDFASEDSHHLDPATMKFNTVMPWLFLAGMTDEDLGAIYSHLRTLPPVKNNVK